jgi:7-cyano-7-deazaguanine synthase in queuosine biosynthesis
MYYDIREIKNEWSLIREFLLEIIAGRQGRYGAKRIKTLLKTEKFKGIVDCLNKFDESRRRALKLAGNFDRSIAIQLEKIDESRLVEKLIELALFIEILDRTEDKHITNSLYNGIDGLILAVLSSYGISGAAATVRINNGFKKFLNEEGGIEGAIVNLTGSSGIAVGMVTPDEEPYPSLPRRRGRPYGMYDGGDIHDRP